MSLVNQMLRDLEDRGADRSAARRRPEGAHQGGGQSPAGGPPPRGRGMRLAGILSALVLLLAATVGYLLWERHLARPAPRAAANAEMQAPSGLPDGQPRRTARRDPAAPTPRADPEPAPTRPVAGTTGQAPGGPGETAPGEGTDLSPGGPAAPEHAHEVTGTDEAEGTGEGPPRGDPDAPAAPDMPAEPDTPAATETAGATGGGAGGARSPDAAATGDTDTKATSPAVAASEPPGYAFQLGTFSSRAHAVRFLAGLPGPVRGEAYIRPVGEYQTVRIGYAETAKSLRPVRERLATHGLEGLLVHASPPDRSGPADSARVDAPDSHAATGNGEVAKAAEGMPADRPAVAAAATEEPVAPEAGPNTGSRVAKKARPLTPAQQAEQAYRRGQRALAAGATSEAEAALREALGQDAGHAEARGALADLLLRRGRQVEAKAVLREGLEAAPQASGLRRRLARVRAEEGETVRAIQLLEEGLAAARDDAGYLALLAALYQRAGRYGESALAYRRALAIRPGTTAWLVGLGISLEGGGRPREAGDAYRRAARTGLPPTLRDFVRKRLNGLNEGNER